MAACHFSKEEGCQKQGLSANHHIRCIRCPCADVRTGCDEAFSIACRKTVRYNDRRTFVFRDVTQVGSMLMKLIAFAGPLAMTVATVAIADTVIRDVYRKLAWLHKLHLPVTTRARLAG